MMGLRDASHRLALVIATVATLGAAWLAETIPASAGSPAARTTDRVYSYDALSAPTTTGTKSRTDAQRTRLSSPTSSGAVRLVSGFGLAAKAVPQLPGGVTIPIGNKKYGLDHIVRRHQYDAVTTTPASKFSRALGAHGIRRTIREAVSAGGPWRVEGSSRVLETGLGRTIGTDLAGNPTNRIRIVTVDAGSVVTAYPIP